MGFLGKLKDKVKAGIGAISEEAKHPGRPPAHRVSGNPFHEAATPAASKEKNENRADRGEGKPWFLDGDNDGWDDTNPDTKK